MEAKCQKCKAALAPAEVELNGKCRFTTYRCTVCHKPRGVRVVPGW